MQKTKIICTLGPSSSDADTIKSMINSGMNVARLNFSHGDHISHQNLIDIIKAQRKKLDKPVAIMLDTKGPEFRIKTFENGKITLVKDQNFTLTTCNVIGNENIVGITYKKLPSLMSEGDRILLNDGFIELVVESVTNYDIITKVVEGGELTNNKSINLPDMEVEMPFLSDQDKDDIRFAVLNDVDYIALSFVRTAEDVKKVRKFIYDNGGSKKNIKLISKIENPTSLNNLNNIVEVSDGLMVARGDLGVEIDMKKVPIFQKSIIEKCLIAGKIVIVATQMLESMTHFIRPTRAEVSDVANAVLDGASAVMLSGETASGENVIRSIETMRDIVLECENNFIVKTPDVVINDVNYQSKTIALAVAAVTDKIRPKAVLVVTESGLTASHVSAFRPTAKIIACTPNDKTYNQMALYYGVEPMHINTCESTDELLALAKSVALKKGMINKGDTIVQTAGLPLGKATDTNILKIDFV